MREEKNSRRVRRKPVGGRGDGMSWRRWRVHVQMSFPGADEVGQSLAAASTSKSPAWAMQLGFSPYVAPLRSTKVEKHECTASRCQSGTRLWVKETCTRFFFEAMYFVKSKTKTSRPSNSERILGTYEICFPQTNSLRCSFQPLWEYLGVWNKPSDEIDDICLSHISTSRPASHQCSVYITQSNCVLRADFYIKPAAKEIVQLRLELSV